MRRSLVGLVLVSLLSLPAIAQARGFYLGAAIGDSGKVGDQLASYYEGAEQGSSGRLFLGKRFGPWGLEASLSGSDLRGLYDGGDYSTMALGIDLKYHLALTSHLELFVRGGLLKASVVQSGVTTARGSADPVLDGNGYTYGAGAQYGFGLSPSLELAIFLDIGKQVLSLQDTGANPVDGSLQMTLIGLSLGF